MLSERSGGAVRRGQCFSAPMPHSMCPCRIPRDENGSSDYSDRTLRSSFESCLNRCQCLGTPRWTRQHSPRQAAGSAWRFRGLQCNTPAEGGGGHHNSYPDLAVQKDPKNLTLFFFLLWRSQSRFSPLKVDRNNDRIGGARTKYQCHGLHSVINCVLAGSAPRARAWRTQTHTVVLSAVCCSPAVLQLSRLVGLCPPFLCICSASITRLPSARA